MIDDRDRAYLSMAAALAVKALGFTHPNPHVGAVVVRGGTIVGTGYHEAAGKPHAEIAALNRAGRKARGATLYVTLEPCVHWGRTPPCNDAVTSAGIARVVVAGLDPNPIVRNRGVRSLRAAGIIVDIDEWSERKARLNEMYAKYITTEKPFVTLKAAISLDGKMATRAGEARWISSPASRDYTHLVRSENDAILVGINTILADDPLLSVRPPNGRGKKILRVILDPVLQTPPRAKILLTPEGGPVLLFANEGAPRSRKEALARRGAEVVVLPGRGSKLDLHRLLADLGRREVTGLLVEGGGLIAAGFLDAKLVDKVLLILAPLLIGGASAISLYGGTGAGPLAEALRLRKTSSFRLGGDLLMEGYL
jgi:diaminohydroxyphosphoribosylaminopyrimidine deaminase/5-amino-6-(5-phosphoribosylamino)uracil reductase